MGGKWNDLGFNFYQAYITDATVRGALHHYGFLSHASQFLFMEISQAVYTIRVLNDVTFTRQSLILLSKLDACRIERNRKD